MKKYFLVLVGSLLVTTGGAYSMLNSGDDCCAKQGACCKKQESCCKNKVSKVNNNKVVVTSKNLL